MGLLDSIIGGLAGGAGNSLRTQGGGLQGQLLQALIALLARRAAAQGGAAGGLGGLGGLAGGLGGGGLGGVLGGMFGGGGNAGAAAPAAPASTGGGFGGLGTLGGLGALAGLAMVANKLRDGGLGDAVGSWVGGGQNQPVSGQQLQGALGSDVIGDLAQQFGLSQEEVSDQLAGALPEVVNHVTPEGQWPDVGAGAADSDLGGLQDIGDLLKRFQTR